ncbi:MAG: carboxymuconolactone decarboxylase family protein [Bacteroidales bacterium]
MLKISYVICFILIFIPGINQNKIMGTTIPDSIEFSSSIPHIVPIAAFTAIGNQDLLKSALVEALDNKIGINIIKEIIIQMYAYSGFPRCLNALHTFHSVLKERQNNGIIDLQGKKANPYPIDWSSLKNGTEIQTMLVGKPVEGGIYEFSPEIDYFLKAHLFGDIFGRDNLNYQLREIATIAALASMDGAERQLESHLNVAINIGITFSQIEEINKTLYKNMGINATKRIDRAIHKKTESDLAELGNGMTMRKVSFSNRNIKLAANLFLPKDFLAVNKYPAIIVGHPAGGVKEQVAGLYAQKLAEAGFITLVFDASYQGESEGEPRGIEDPAVRVEDFRCAIDYLSTLPFIDADKIGAMGICGGGGFAINSAITDVRIKAVAGVSAVDLGRLRREGLNNSFSVQMQQERLLEVGKQRILEANGAPVKYNNYVPNSESELPANASKMYREGYEYYRTSRAQHPNSTNKYTFTSLDKLIGFSAFSHLEMLAPRPLLMIAGSNAESLYFSQDAYNQAREPKELWIIDGASHIDLYDIPQYTSLVSDKLAAFFNKYIKSL